LAPYFSELALFKYRIRIEIEYFISLAEIPLDQLKDLDPNVFSALRDIYLDFSLQDGERIKEIESVTNHDVKAVEYFVKEKLKNLGLDQYKEFIHFGLTSQDINNTATPLLLKEGFEIEVLPKLNDLIVQIGDLESRWKDIPMLARTHGQPASPTRLGKEMAVFRERILRQLELLRMVPYTAKFGGATGNLNAHFSTFPQLDWHDFARQFVEKLGLKRSYPTTQIEHYDNLAAFFDSLKRINTILIDFARDIWHYISIEYFKQKIVKNEVGSSAMPHKVNPIDFENAEGNLGYANAVFEFLSTKLPVSRLQRDLTDSTVLRNIGDPLAHSFIAYTYLIKGIGKLELNESKLQEDLENNWAVVSEGIQNILRKEGYPEPFEALKSLTRKNEKITEESIKDFINKLNVRQEVKDELNRLSPYNYLGR
jgi:adenylosuccinate lyase